MVGISDLTHLTHLLVDDIRVDLHIPGTHFHQIFLCGISYFFRMKRQHVVSPLLMIGIGDPDHLTHLTDGIADRSSREIIISQTVRSVRSHRRCYRPHGPSRQRQQVTSPCRSNTLTNNSLVPRQSPGGDRQRSISFNDSGCQSQSPFIWKVSQPTNPSNSLAWHRFLCSSNL